MDHVRIEEHPDGGWCINYSFDSVEDAVRAAVEVLPELPVISDDEKVEAEIDKAMVRIDDEFRRRCERRDSTVTKKRRAAAAKKAYYYPPDKTRSRWQHVAEAVVNVKW